MWTFLNKDIEDEDSERVYTRTIDSLPYLTKWVLAKGYLLPEHVAQFQYGSTRYEEIPSLVAAPVITFPDSWLVKMVIADRGEDDRAGMYLAFKYKDNLHALPVANNGPDASFCCGHKIRQMVEELMNDEEGKPSSEQLESVFWKPLMESEWNNDLTSWLPKINEFSDLTPEKLALRGVYGTLTIFDFATGKQAWINSPEESWNKKMELRPKMGMYEDRELDAIRVQFGLPRLMVKEPEKKEDKPLPADFVVPVVPDVHVGSVVVTRTIGDTMYQQIDGVWRPVVTEIVPGTPQVERIA